MLGEVPQVEKPNARESTVRPHVRATIFRPPLLAVNIQKVVQVQRQPLELGHHSKHALTRWSRSLIIVGAMRVGDLVVVDCVEERLRRNRIPEMDEAIALVAEPDK